MTSDSKSENSERRRNGEAKDVEADDHTSAQDREGDQPQAEGEKAVEPVRGGDGRSQRNRQTAQSQTRQGALSRYEFTDPIYGRPFCFLIGGDLDALDAWIGRKFPGAKLPNSIRTECNG